ncbi:MAG TPA: proton-conducting transporter membrane subunit, partial [Candidatus Sulfotelmatobacter sp.]|nr:proton-conducting transporter membrane subunit [Candidatus Sulfotelmatobacter sp.]
LSALFLVVAGLVFLPVSIFSAGYARRYAGTHNLAALGLGYHALFASVTLLLCSDSVVLFLLAWESMTIFCYLLINFEHEREHSRSAAYLFLVMAEFGTAAVVLAFLLLSRGAGSLDFASIRAGASQLGVGAQWAIFLLSFFGFGVKAGLVPLNTWLPRAHPAAPANVSAILSGAILNMGLYGMLRINGDLLPIGLVAPGIVVLGIGVISALVGILYATTANDLKTMLAHSSIENIGIVVTGLGAAFVFRASGFPGLAAILFVAALYHMTNHSVYKSLLFMAAGNVDDATGTRDLDRLGGLARWMPLTSVFFLVGALSIAAIPPFNGFVSEWLTLQGLLRSAELTGRGVKIAFVLAGVGLALTAGLAVTCFIKAFAMGFLGLPRTPAARKGRERKGLTVVSLGIPALLCLGLGILPTYVIPIMDRAAVPIVNTVGATDQLIPPFFIGSPRHDELPPGFVAEFHDIGAQTGQGFLAGRGLVLLHRGGEDQHVVFAMSPSYSILLLVVLLGITYGVVRGVTRRRSVRRAPAWDGGLHRLLPEMTYTATGFSNPVRVIFRAVFRPRSQPDVHEAQVTHFRTAIRREYDEVHVVSRVLIDPMTKAARWISETLARIHNGRINTYVAYMLLTLAVFILVAWLAGI